jgi:hypothetical protein
MGLGEGLALMSHYVGVAVIATAVIGVHLGYPDVRRRLWSVQSIPAGLLALWLPSALTQFSHAGSELERIALIQGSKAAAAVKFPVQLLAGEATTTLEAVPGKTAGLMLIVGFISLLLGLVTAWMRADRRVRPSFEFLLIAGVAVSTPVMILLVTLLPDKSMLTVRNALPSLPAILILLAWACRIGRRYFGTAAAILLLAGMATATVLTLSRYQRPQGSYLAASVSGRWQPNTAILHVCCAGVDGPPGMMIGMHLSGGPRLSYQLLKFDDGFGPALKKAAATNSRVIMVFGGPETGVSPGLFDGFLPGMTRVWSREWPGYSVLYASEYVRTSLLRKPSQVRAAKPR